MNTQRTYRGSVTGVLPKRFELIDRDGNVCGIFGTVSTAAIIARQRWPDQSQDPDRTGKGWDIQVAK